MMPYCKRRPENYDKCGLEGRVSCTFKEHFRVDFRGIRRNPDASYRTKTRLISTHGSMFLSRGPSARHDLRMSTCRYLIYHGDDLCNNPGVMKLVTQTAICYWFHANAFDSWWRLALALNGAVSWWVDSFVVVACTLVQTDTDNVNNPVRAADDIYWALILNLENKCVMCVFIASLRTFLLPEQRFSFICWAFTRVIGAAPLAFP